MISLIGRFLFSVKTEDIIEHFCVCENCRYTVYHYLPKGSYWMFFICVRTVDIWLNTPMNLFKLNVFHLCENCRHTSSEEAIWTFLCVKTSVRISFSFLKANKRWFTFRSGLSIILLVKQITVSNICRKETQEIDLWCYDGHSSWNILVCIFIVKLIVLYKINNQ